jgi:hypothetical protein
MIFWCNSRIVKRKGLILKNMFRRAQFGKTGLVPLSSSPGSMESGLGPVVKKNYRCRGSGK